MRRRLDAYDLRVMVYLDFIFEEEDGEEEDEEREQDPPDWTPAPDGEE